MVDIVGNETLASLWDKLARECGDKDFFIFQDREGDVSTYSYRAFNELIDQTANMLLSQGVKRGEHVAVRMHTCPEFLMCLFGLAKIGAVLVPMNEQYLQAECEYALDMCSTRRAVVEPCYVELYDAIHADGRLDQGIIVARSEGGEEAMG
nr:AMP-binding protein [Senegalimassilia sp.]